MPIQNYGNIGPLQIFVVPGSELIPGDIIDHNHHLKVVVRSYSLEHLKRQALDVDSGEVDEDGQYISPYRINVPMDEKFTILRAPCNETSVSDSPARNQG